MKIYKTKINSIKDFKKVLNRIINYTDECYNKSETYQLMKKDMEFHCSLHYKSKLNKYKGYNIYYHKLMKKQSIIFKQSE